MLCSRVSTLGGIASHVGQCWVGIRVIYKLTLWICFATSLLLLFFYCIFHVYVACGVVGWNMVHGMESIKKYKVPSVVLHAIFAPSPRRRCYIHEITYRKKEEKFSLYRFS